MSKLKRYIYELYPPYLCLVSLDRTTDTSSIHETNYALGCRVSSQVCKLLISCKGKRIVPRMRPISVLVTLISPKFSCSPIESKHTKFICANKYIASSFFPISLAASNFSTADLNFFPNNPVPPTGVAFFGGASTGSSRDAGLCTKITVAAFFA